MLTAIAFVVTIGILVVWHEMGHYLAARWCGVHVIRFSFGFGRVLYKWQGKAGGTEWAFSAIPLGGYVAMLDDRDPPGPDISPEQRANSLNNQSLIKRAFIIAAGPLANFLLAILVYWALAVYGTNEPAPILDAAPAGSLMYQSGFTERLRIAAIDGDAVSSYGDVSFRLSQAAVARSRVEMLTTAPDTVGADRAQSSGRVLSVDFSSVSADQIEGNFLPTLGVRLAPPMPLVETIVAGSPAEKAGLRGGDLIVRVGEIEKPNADAVAKTIRAAAGQEIPVTVMRAGQVIELRPTPEKDANGQVRIGIGFASAPQVLVRHGPFEAIGVAVTKTWEISVFSLKMLGQIVTGQASLSNLSGPLTIADVAGKTASIGFVSFASFLALVSVGLGILNLLPIPMLDGGHLLYYVIEAVTGKAPSERLMAMGQVAGALALGVLMTVALTNDVLRLFVR